MVDMQLSDPSQNAEIMKALEGLEDLDSISEVEGRINVHALNALGKLPKIMAKVEDSGLRIADLSVRQNTLEDVFIDLTGTRLRE